MASTLRMRSGLIVDALNPDPKDISIFDIAYGLAGTFRYRGQSRLTVAQHSVLACLYFYNLGQTTLAYSALMHDATEWLCGDVPAPIKHAAEFEAYKAIEDRVGEILSAKYKFSWPKPDQVHTIDKRLCLSERRDLFQHNTPEEDTLQPLSLSVQIWTPEFAEEQFLWFFDILSPMGIHTDETTVEVAA